MIRTILAVTMLSAIAAPAEARWRDRRAAQPSCSVAVSAPTLSLTTARDKAEYQARTGVMQHVGPVPAGCVEGVGYSSSSPEQALRTCYSNSGLPCVEEAVVRGPAGWFAVRIFRK